MKIRVIFASIIIMTIITLALSVMTAADIIRLFGSFATGSDYEKFVRNCFDERHDASSIAFVSKVPQIERNRIIQLLDVQKGAIRQVRIERDIGTLFVGQAILENGKVLVFYVDMGRKTSNGSFAPGILDVYEEGGELWEWRRESRARGGPSRDGLPTKKEALQCIDG